MLIIVCGVTGCGKSSLGKELAQQLNYEFADADDYHPEINKSLMRQGKALDDDLRLPWLLSIHEKLKIWDDQKISGIFACSALKKIYRRVLSTGLNYVDALSSSLVIKNLDIKFILLNCDMELIRTRLEKRNNHEIIKKETVANIIRTQFETIELPSKLDSIWTSSHDERNFLVKEYDAYFIYVLNCDSKSTVKDLAKDIIQFLNLMFKENSIKNSFIS